MSQPGLSFGIEIAPDWSLGAIVNPAGDVLHRLEVCDAVDETLAAARAAAGDAIVAASVTAADHESPDTAAALAAVRRSFSSAAVVPAPLPSGIALALGERASGAARGARHIAAFAIRDHPVAGILLDGHPWAGAHGRAGAVAWLALNPVEREDYRRTGCLDAEAGPAGMVRRLVWRVKSGDRSKVADRVNGDFSRISVEDVLAGAREGDGVAISVLRDTVKYLAMAVANLVTILDPEIVVLGGLIESDADLVLDSLKGDVARRVPPASAASVRIEVSQLGAHGPAIGAAVHALSAAVS
jgi:hypothetical protein